MIFRTRTFLLFAFVLSGLVTVHRAERSDHVCSSLCLPYLRCEKKDAETTLEVILGVDGVFSERKSIIYYRKTTAADGEVFPAPFNVSGNADGVSKSGKGIGYNTSLTLTQVDDGVGVDLEVSWDLESERGKNSLIVKVPYDADRKGRIAGISYSCLWKKIR